MTALLLTYFTAVPVLAEEPEIVTVYVDQNFDDAEYDFDPTDISISDPQPKPKNSKYHPVSVLNHATGKNMPWQTLVRDWKTDNYTNYAKITVIGTNPDDTTNYALVAGRKAQIPFYLNIDDEVDGEFIPAPVYEEGKLIYIDLRIKRTATINEDDVTFYLLDSNNREILTIYYKSGRFPRLNTGGVNYGGEGSAETPTINYPYTTDWLSMRTIIDFETKTFKQFIGEDLDSLVPMVDGIIDFGFKNAAAENLYTIKSATKGGLGFDDLKIYSVTPSQKPVASDITVSGKPNVGATLTGTYGTYTDATPEGASYCYWEAANNISFAGPTKITEDMPIQEGETDEFVITEAEKGKYLRFTVVPVNENGIEGDPVSSAPIPYPAGVIVYNLRTTGPIKGGTIFDLKFASNVYPAVVDVLNTSDEPANAVLIAAWYKNGNITEVYSAPVEVPAGSSEELGFATAEVSTTAKTIPAGGDINGVEFKIFLWDGFSNIKPLEVPVRYHQ